MTTNTETIVALILNRMVDKIVDAEESAYAAELAAAKAELDAAHRREVYLDVENLECHGTIAEQQDIIDALEHAAVSAHEAYRRVVAERDALLAHRVGGIAVWSPKGSRN